MTSQQADNNRRGSRDAIADRTRNLKDCIICLYPHSSTETEKWITCPIATCRRSFCFKCWVSNSPKSDAWGDVVFHRRPTFAVRCLCCQQYIDLNTGDHRANNNSNGVHTRTGAGL